MDFFTLARLAVKFVKQALKKLRVKRLNLPNIN